MATIKELTRKIEITRTNLESLDIHCGRLRTDSLKCEKGDTFVALRGGRADGHDFISTAVSHGATLVVCEKVTEYLLMHPEICYIEVKSTRLALSHMWNELCHRPSDRLILVAVTGTNGKTSTTYFLRHIFAKAGYVTGVIGTVVCHIGDRTEVLSDALDSSVNSMTTPEPENLYPMLEKMADEGVEVVFMEASSHALSQYRLDPLKFTVGIFTGLTHEHLDYHHSMEEYYAAKKRLFSMCGVALINGDSEYAKRLCLEIPIPSVTYTMAEGSKSLGNDTSYFAVNGDYNNIYGISYTFCDKNGSSEIRCPVTGRFMASNTLAAASCARLFAIKPSVIREALENCPQIAGRMERIFIGDDMDFTVFIDYAHTPDALEGVLHSLASFKKPGARLVALFGCGGDRDRTKRPIMGKIATTLADLTVITADNCRTENPRSIIYDILHGVTKGVDCKVIEKRENAIKWVIENHRPDDIILLAGKGHEDYEIDENGKHPFSERKIVLSAVEQLRHKRG